MLVTPGVKVPPWYYGASPDNPAIVVLNSTIGCFSALAIAPLNTESQLSGRRLPGQLQLNFKFCSEVCGVFSSSVLLYRKTTKGYNDSLYCFGGLRDTSDQQFRWGTWQWAFNLAKMTSGMGILPCAV